MAHAQRSLLAEIRLPFALGLVVILLFVGGFGTWAAVAPFTRGIVAMGQLVPTGNRRSIQHLEGGIIADIAVRDGMRVAQGDLLLRLETTRLEADHRALVETSVRLAAEALRLRAERELAQELGFPDELVKIAARSGLQRILEDERWRFAQHIAARENELAALRERISFGESTIEVIQRQIKARQAESKVGEERQKLTAQLVKSGSRPAFALMEGEEQMARVQANLASALAELESERLTVAETKAQLASYDDRRLVEIGDRLSVVETELAAARNQLGRTEDMLARTEIRAPIDGIVLNSVAHTIGGVLPAGATVMELVPSNEALVAELRVAPTDVDRVHPGARCRIRLLAFPQRHTPPMAGAILSVSADVVHSPAGQSYYLARAELDPADIAGEDGTPLQLTPGMPLQAVIEAGGGTFLGYLLEPLERSFERAFKDS